MKKYAKILCTALAIVMIASSVVVLAACSTVSINWEDYLPTPDEWQKILDNTDVPKFEKVNIDSNAYVNNYDLSSGLVTISDGDYVYGYLPLTNKRFGEGENYHQIIANNVYYSSTIYYMAYKNNSMTLFNSEGYRIAEGVNIFVSDLVAENAHRTGKYLSIKVTNENFESTEYYVEIGKNGELSQNLLTKIPYNDDIPQVGSLLESKGEYLLDVLDLDFTDFIDYSEQEDEFLNNITVQTYGSTMVFYSEGKQLCSWNLPVNVAMSPIYVNGKLLYATSTHVDAMSSKGYNFVDSKGDKFNWQMYSLNIKTGKVSKLNTNYVVTNDDVSVLMYNRSKGKYDLAMVTAIPKIDGIAYEDFATDAYLINCNGQIAFSALNDSFGMPMVKIGKNYLTITGNIVTARGKLVTSLSDATALAITSDRIVLNVNGKVGAIDFDGIVKTAFNYTLWGDETYGNHAIAQDEDDHYYFINFYNGTARRVDNVLDVDESDIVFARNSYLIGARRSDGTDWYTVDGTLVISAATNSYLSIPHYTIGGKQFGWLKVTVKGASGSEVEYYRIVF